MTGRGYGKRAWICDTVGGREPPEPRVPPPFFMRPDFNPIPQRIPKKSRIRFVPELWLQKWLAREDLTHAERKRVEWAIAYHQGIKNEVRIALLVEEENGAMPVQEQRVDDLLNRYEPDEIFHTWSTRSLHARCRKHVQKKPRGRVVLYDKREEQRMIKDSTLVIAVVNDMTPGQEGIWKLIRYANHRKLPVIVVSPDGTSWRR